MILALFPPPETACVAHEIGISYKMLLEQSPPSQGFPLALKHPSCSPADQAVSHLVSPRSSAGDVEVALSGLTSRTKEWLWSPPPAWEGRKVWAGKRDGEFSRRNRAEYGAGLWSLRAG